MGLVIMGKVMTNTELERLIKFYNMNQDSNFAELKRRVEVLEGVVGTLLPTPAARHKSGAERLREEIMSAEVDLVNYKEMDVEG